MYTRYADEAAAAAYATAVAAAAAIKAATATVTVSAAMAGAAAAAKAATSLCGCLTCCPAINPIMDVLACRPYQLCYPIWSFWLVVPLWLLNVLPCYWLLCWTFWPAGGAGYLSNLAVLGPLAMIAFAVVLLWVANQPSNPVAQPGYWPASQACGCLDGGTADCPA